MSLQDPISDMLAVIKNGQMVKKAFVTTPLSHLKIAILKVLEEEGYISGFETLKDKMPRLAIYLKYFNEKPVIENLRRVSRPGLRIYRKKDEIPKVRGGLGISILSTPNGVMSDRQAKQLGQGGEILCTVA
jgi:small subunit ribosomal protein S8